MAQHRTLQRQTDDTDTEHDKNKKRRKISSVCFQEIVEVREFERELGGSQGVPQSGHWPLGLAWDIYRQYQSPIKQHISTQRTLAKRVPEHTRKQILLQTQLDPEHVQHEKNNIEDIRNQRRNNMFCSCQSPHSRILTRSTRRELDASKSKSSSSRSQYSMYSSSSHLPKKTDKLCSIARPDPFGHYCECAQAGLPCISGLCVCSIECGNPFGSIIQKKKKKKTKLDINRLDGCTDEDDV
jgi:hypothetical protein